MDIRRTTSVLGLSTAIFASGVNFSASYLTMPVLTRFPATTTTSFFDEYFHSGAILLIPITAISVISNSLASYYASSYARFDPLTGPPNSNAASGYAAAAGITMSSMVWTVVMMSKTNNRLCEINAEIQANKDKVVSQEEVTGLLKQWTWMNYVRSGIYMVGGVVGLLTFAEVI